MADSRKVLGKEGERLAEDYLKKKGYKVLERNYRCPLGELDLVALDGRVVVFVEVKIRTDERFGHPLEAVHWRKQDKMIQAAQFFLAQYKLHQREARFDVVGISRVGERPVIEHVRNAFDIDTR
ncbi:MAG TPA: YraN family protein [Candidatus Acidoferrales bacterium]|nr:YraN family protein [Candidatus Acidoferrales bacterium]